MTEPLTAPATGRIIGADVGGTFTDVVAWDGVDIATAKVPTSTDQSEAVLAGAAELAEGVDAFLHGTTTATNALLERSGARTLLLTTAGFEDVIEIGRQDRPTLYDPMADRPPPLVGRADRFPDLHGADLSRYGAVAISLLGAFEDPAAEQELAAAVRNANPELSVSLSSEVAPEFREFERTSTTVINAYLQPLVARYLASLEERVRSSGMAERVQVMRSSGGLISSEGASRLPAAILLSGPAGGTVAAGALADAHGVDRVISFDMGGTSTDVCLIESGSPEIAYTRAVAGYPCLMPAAAIHTVGAGGGSIGWVDSGGSLRVGPRSAGADPGPACYGKGGEHATVTDANVFLGMLAPDAALAGRLVINRALAERAIAALAGIVGLDLDHTALGMVRVAEEAMAGAIRTVTIEQGVDPRGAHLVAFGGAGGLHATALARALDMRGVIVPARAGVFSALGLLLSPPRIDVARSVLLRSGDDALDGEVQAVADEGAQRLPAGDVTTMVDVRYLGQSHELAIPYQVGDGWHRLAERFHRAHDERNGFSRPSDPIEAVTVRAAAVGKPWFTLADLPTWQSVGRARSGSRTVRTGEGLVKAAVWQRDTLKPGAGVAGPAIIEEREATTWVGPGEQAVVHPTGAMEISW